MESAQPILWHIAFSHYSEKARWALDYKGVEYESRTPVPGLHMAPALWVTRGRHVTLPILGLDGARIGDSTAIIAALELRFPEPALHPGDADERRRALALEDWFDEQLGPYIRRLVFHELRRDSELLAEIGARAAPALVARLGRAAVPYSRAFTALRYGAGSDEAAERARGQVCAALERLEAELGDGDYLVGEHFTVADLTAAALFYPLVRPPEAPPALTHSPARFERFREPLRTRRGYRWVEEIYRRHRHPAAGNGTTDARAGRATAQRH